MLLLLLAVLAVSKLEGLLNGLIATAIAALTFGLGLSSGRQHADQKLE